MDIDTLRIMITRERGFGSMGEFLREISNDKEVPKQRRKINEDGLFETTDCTDPDHQCTCGAKQVTLIED